MGYTRWVVGLLGLWVLGCSSDDGGPAKSVDCSWFASRNCWNDVVDAAYACSSGFVGTFDATRSQCTAGDGKVTFGKPVPTDFDSQDYKWDATVIRGTKQCAHVIDTAEALEVESPAGVFRMALQGSQAIIECPDGSRYSIGVQTALTCSGDSFTPGFSYGYTSPGPTSVNFDLSGAPFDSASLFDCSGP